MRAEAASRRKPCERDCGDHGQTGGWTGYVFACILVHHRPRCECDPAACLGLDWRQHVVRDPALTRPSEILSGRAETSHATATLEWTARSRMKDVARMMVEARLASQASSLRRAA